MQVSTPVPAPGGPAGRVRVMIRPLRHQVGASRMVAKPYSRVPPPTASPSTATVSSDANSFVFHDVSGRRWSRIKRVMFAVAAALVVIIGAVLLALTHVAPGRAQSFSSLVPQQVPDWPIRNSAGADTPAKASGPGPAAPPGGARLQPNSASTPKPSPTLSPTTAPTPTARATPRPKRTRPPLVPNFF